MAVARADIHFHLLPGVDDGPASMEESVELARAAALDGSRTIVATPHVRGDYVTDVDVLPELVHSVREQVRRAGIGIEIRCGAEVGCDMVGRLGQADFEHLALGPPGARWLLLETPFEGIDAEVHAAIDELHDRGFAVVLAHPERSADLLGEHEPALRHERERERGTLVQVNALSLLGRHGPDAREAAAQLMLDGRADVIASDAHSLAREPALTAALEAAEASGAPASAARRLIDATPARLLARGIRAAPARVPA